MRGAATTRSRRADARDAMRAVGGGGGRKRRWGLEMEREDGRVWSEFKDYD